MNPDHPVLDLWKRHHPSAYPEGVIPVPAAIPGTAFFPGGYGLWNSQADADLPEFPRRGVMIVGHDFHSEAGYKLSFENGRERETQPTWGNLLKVLRGADIPLTRCFFTNYYMGLRKGSATTGVFPGARDSDFHKHCSKFFIKQLAAMRPSLIVTLGKYVPALIAPLSPDLNAWCASKDFQQIDAAGALKRNCRFDGVPGFEAVVVALTHPSMRHASLRYRYPRTSGGIDPEVALLKNALRGTSFVG
jgi:hypothetical protein